jgi:F0F1-type ATP synthase membrane subunit b/b'
MFSIFHDVHTYLVISFVSTVVILFKLGYAKLDDWLKKSVNDIRDLIAGLEERKRSCEKVASTLDGELKSARDMADDMLRKSEEDARSFLDRRLLEIDSEAARKEEELADEARGVENGLVAELAKRCVSAVSSEIYDKISESAKDKDFQKLCFDRSVEMVSKRFSQKG